MIVDHAEECFRRGKALLSVGRHEDALAFFLAALHRQRAGSEREEARYVSYYGLCLGLTHTDRYESLRLCRDAVSIEDFRPDLWWNLGRVALIVGHRGEAHRSFERGLMLDPAHHGLRKDLARMGVRRRPVLGFVPRNHRINVFLGKLRALAVSPGA